MSWLLFGVFTLLVAAPQLPVYFSKAFGGRKVQHPDGRLTGFIRFVPIWQDQVRVVWSASGFEWRVMCAVVGAAAVSMSRVRLRCGGRPSCFTCP
jgi:hypothetical protein